MMFSVLAVAPGVQAALLSDDLTHKRQLGIAAMPGVGYGFIVPYAEDKDCGDRSGDSSKRVCTNTVPFFLDLQFSFGVTSRIDLITDLRFGVAGQAVTGNHQFALAPGIRIWVDQESHLKFYATIQGVIDTTNQQRAGIRDTDLGFRNANGLMFDSIRNVGFFVQFGETLGFRRWFRMDLDVGAGVQIRFP